MYSLLDGEYEFIEAKVLEKSDLLNKKIKDSDLPENVRIGAIVRGKQVMIPGGNFIFEKDDLVVLLASKDQLKKLKIYLVSFNFFSQSTAVLRIYFILLNFGFQEKSFLNLSVLATIILLSPSLLGPIS